MDQTLASYMAYGPVTLTLQAASNFVLFLSLTAISVAILLYIFRKEPEFKVGGFVAAGFVFWLGLLYLGSFLALWYPIHLLLAVTQAMTAVVLLITSIALFPLMPRLLEILTPQEYETVIQQLYDANQLMKKTTDEKITESQQITHELNNRVRHVLATVHGISKETARSAKCIGTYLDKFSARMTSLTHCNELLLTNGWRGANLSDVIRSQLEQYTELEAVIELEGEDIYINPLAVQNISLALHELAANNAAHTNGDVKKCTISWEKHEDQYDNAENDTLKLSWNEARDEGLPLSDYKGFGHSVLDYIVPTSLNGMSELRIQANTVRWNLEVPINNVC